VEISDREDGGDILHMRRVDRTERSTPNGVSICRGWKGEGVGGDVERPRLVRGSCEFN